MTHRTHYGARCPSRPGAASLATSLAVVLWLGVSAAGCAAIAEADTSATAPGRSTVSFAASGRDLAGRFVGGTELRLLVTHGGRLYAWNGYWKDRPGSERRQGAQALVLDAPGMAWRVDHVFDDRLPGERPRDLSVGALAEVTLATDGAGRSLPHPVALLLASTWDLSGASRVFTRDDRNGNWDAVTLAQERPAADFLPQVRSFGTHRDRVTGVDLVFAGQTPRGVFAGHYDADAPGRVRWGAEPEPGAASTPTAFPGLDGKLRISSFAEANGRLYAAVGQQVFKRMDGPPPRWRPVYINPHPGAVRDGPARLTATPAAGGRQMLLAAVEGSAARLVRIDPETGSDSTELDLKAFLGRAWGMQPGYVIAAYNDMASVEVPGRGRALLIGLMAFIPEDEPVAPGHTLVDVGYSRVEGSAWFLARWPDGSFGLHRVTASFARPPVAVRTIVASPFPGEAGAIYLGGFDANKTPAHNTAWVVRNTLADALAKLP